MGKRETLGLLKRQVKRKNRVRHQSAKRLPVARTRHRHRRPRLPSSRTMFCGIVRIVRHHYERYTNVGIMSEDGQASAPEAAVLGGEFETGLALFARPSGGPLWICSLPCSGWQEA